MTDAERKRLAELIRQLYALVDELELIFPKRSFTPDGHLVGSLGEAMAAYMYSLSPLRQSSELHDARAADGRKVQVKLTGGKRGFAAYGKPEHLIALCLHKGERVEEVFNGPGAIAWKCAGKKAKNGQHRLPLKKLAAANRQVPEDKRLKLVNDLILC